MITNCKNCQTEFSGNFSNNCGQPAETHAMNFHFLWHDVQHGFFHFDKGVLYTTKQLFTRPGHSIREYLEGKRVNHFKPISLVILLAGIYGLLYHYFHINMLEGLITIKGTGQEYTDVQSFLVRVNSWMGEHYSIVALLQLPVAALGTFLSFLNRAYNYVEHFILNAFLTAQSLIVHIVLFPLTYMFNEKPALRTLTIIENIVSIGLVVWVLLQFFSGYKKSSTFWRTILSFVIYTFLYLVLSIVTGIIIYYVRKSG